MEEVKIIRSNRKTLSVQVNAFGEVIVRAPIKKPIADIRKFLDEKQAWIRKHVLAARSSIAQTKNGVEPFTDGEIAAFKATARRIIPQKVAFFAQIMGVSYNGIAIRGQTSKWGSCSAKGNLNFNFLLAGCPDEVCDYVVVHELCHLKQMNHSKRFWAEVYKYCPEYPARKAWLKSEGRIFIERLKQAKAEK